MPGAEHPGGLHVVLLPRGEHGGAHHAGRRGPAEDAQRADHRPDAVPRPVRGGPVQQHDRGQQQGDAEHDVGQPGQHRVQPTAEVPGRHADPGGDQPGERRREYPDQQRGTCAVDGAGEHVAALEVVPEPRGPARRGHAAVQRAVGRVGTGEQARRDGHHDHDDEDRHRYPEHRPPPQSPPRPATHNGSAGRARRTAGPRRGSPRGTR